MNKSIALTYFKFILIASLSLLLSCQTDSTSGLDVKPADLISESKMVSVLIDIHVAESALSIKNFNRDSSLTLFAYYKEEIFKEHQITEQQFKDSYQYYSTHSEEFDHIYEVVVDSLAVKEMSGKLN